MNLAIDCNCVPVWRAGDFVSVEFDEARIGHTREQARGGFTSYNRKMSSGTFGAQEFRLRGLAFFAANPDLFEQMIDANVFVGGNWRATIGGVGQRAGHRMIGAVLRSIEGKIAVCQLDAAVSPTREVGIMRGQQDGVGGFVLRVGKSN